MRVRLGVLLLRLVMSFLGSVCSFFGSSWSFLGSVCSFFGSSWSFLGFASSFFGSSCSFLGSACSFFGSSRSSWARCAPSSVRRDLFPAFRRSPSWASPRARRSGYGQRFFDQPV